MSALTVSGLTKGFSGAPVLDALELAVPAGSLLSVLGPSGCGKTTLLRLVAGFLRPDAGSIELDGHPVAGDGRWVPAPKRRIGYVAQEGALFPHLDVAANVGFGLPRAERRARARTRELLALVELEPGLLDRYPHELSGGQQQRVALARALARRPSLVLLDEPFAALDARLRLQTGAAVTHALRAAEATAILVTHDQAEALSLTDTVAVMRDGRIVQSGPPVDVYGAPSDLGVARFLGEAIVLPAELVAGVAKCALGSLPTTGEMIDGPAELLIRPEQLVLGEHGTPARVDQVTFLGHDAIVRLRLTETGLGVTAQVLGGPLPGPGAEARVSVRGPVRAYGIDSMPPGAPT